MKVLVTSASKHGATSEIAAAIARTLASRGIDTVLTPVDEVDGLHGYDAVVLGSAVYAGRWLESAREFADAHAVELTARPTWLFSSGPIGEPPTPEERDAVQVDPIVQATGAREHRLFSGRLDRSLLGFGERAIVLAIRAPEGDFRDWEAISGWATEIADALDRL